MKKIKVLSGVVVEDIDGKIHHAHPGDVHPVEDHVATALVHSKRAEIHHEEVKASKEEIRTPDPSITNRDPKVKGR